MGFLSVAVSIRDLDEDVSVTGRAQRAPASQILPTQFAPRSGCEPRRDLILEPLHAFRPVAVATDDKRVAPSGRTRDHDAR